MAFRALYEAELAVTKAGRRGEVPPEMLARRDELSGAYDEARWALDLLRFFHGKDGD